MVASNNEVQWEEPGPLFTASVARKRAEQDAMLLANRIRLLRAEEDKTRKKIRDTEKKTQEIIEIRRRNEEKRIAREAEQAVRDAQENEFRQRSNAGRNDHSQKLQEKQRSLQESNAASSEMVRRERELAKQALEEQRLLEQAEMIARAERVRGALQAATRSRARSEGAKQEQAKELVRERLLREEDERRARLNDIDRMEREEADLIARLQQSQERHRVAFLRLEDVIRQQGQPSMSTPKAVIRPANSTSLPPPGQLGRGSTSARVTSAASTSSGQSRPPRPRPRPTGQGPEGPEGSGGPVGEQVPSPAVRQGSGLGSTAMSTQVDGSGRQVTQKNSGQVDLDCSASGTEQRGIEPNESSGHSPPCSGRGHQMTYTTVDGQLLDIPAEEDLDLASLLNS